MGKTIKAEIKGLERTRRKFQKLGKAGLQAFRGAMYAEGLHIIGIAAKEAPAVTGRLRNSHFATWPDRNGSLEVGFGVKYAASIEYGTRVIQMTRQRQKAAFANMKETGWKKSAVGGPGFFRGAITTTSAGRVRRIAKTAKRYFAARVGFMADGSIPKSAREARNKGK